MNDYVKYCDKSTITEAWAVIKGAPGKVNDSEGGSVENNASKLLDDFKRTPSFVVLEKSQEDESVPAFWHKQLAWESGKYLTRIGHRYLSVHFIKKGNEKYEKYETSIKPHIIKWLNAYKQTVSGQKEQYPLESVGFGYINLFRLPAENFDLSRYFKINFGTGVESAKTGIARLEMSFLLDNPKVNVNILVTPEAPDSENVIVRTRIEAHKVLEDNCSFENKEEILALIGKTQDSAKDVFFDLATKETHEIMGARYDSSST